MRLIKTLFLTMTVLFVLHGCCWSDHSATIKEVVEPMLHELQAFYQKHKRFPTAQERDAMLEKVGCRVKGDVCVHKRTVFNIDSGSGYDYFITFNYERTFCSVYLKPDGSVTEPSCHNEPCISLKQ